MALLKIIDGRTWRTPLTQVPLRTVRSARLKKVHYRGTYHNEGIDGFEYWRSTTWLPVIILQQWQGRRRPGERWKIWMVDDPVHWHGMAEAVADLPAGEILVAGLGLGLMLHHMAAQPRFTRITVVENNRDVVELMQPTLPPDPRVTIVVDDFYRVLATQPPVDGVLWDLATGSPSETFADLVTGKTMVQLYLGGGVPVVQFGVRRSGAPVAPLWV